MGIMEHGCRKIISVDHINHKRLVLKPWWIQKAKIDGELLTITNFSNPRRNLANDGIPWEQKTNRKISEGQNLSKWICGNGEVSNLNLRLFAIGELKSGNFIIFSLIKMKHTILNKKEAENYSFRGAINIIHSSIISSSTNNQFNFTRIYNYIILRFNNPNLM